MIPSKCINPFYVTIITNLPATHSESLAIMKQIKHELEVGNYLVTNTRPTIVSALGALPKPKGIFVFYMKRAGLVAFH